LAVEAHGGVEVRQRLGGAPLADEELPQVVTRLWVVGDDVTAAANRSNAVP
jgi:hypothetical protein